MGIHHTLNSLHLPHIQRELYQSNHLRPTDLSSICHSDSNWSFTDQQLCWKCSFSHSKESTSTRIWSSDKRTLLLVPAAFCLTVQAHPCRMLFFLLCQCNSKYEGYAGAHVFIRQSKQWQTRHDCGWPFRVKSDLTWELAPSLKTRCQQHIYPCRLSSISKTCF